MALVGKWTKTEKIQSETETEIVTVNYPSELPDGHPDFEKAGTTEEIESPIYDTVSTEYDNAYITVHSINSWKFQARGKNETLFNITYRVYESKSDRENDINSHLYQDFVSSQTLDFTSNKNDTEQAYDILKTVGGFEELIND